LGGRGAPLSGSTLMEQKGKSTGGKSSKSKKPLLVHIRKRKRIGFKGGTGGPEKSRTKGSEIQKSFLWGPRGGREGWMADVEKCGCGELTLKKGSWGVTTPLGPLHVCRSGGELRRDHH